jgi:hypothetical protein
MPLAHILTCTSLSQDDITLLYLSLPFKHINTCNRCHSYPKHTRKPTRTSFPKNVTMSAATHSARHIHSLSSAHPLTLSHTRHQSCILTHTLIYINTCYTGRGHLAISLSTEHTRPRQRHLHCAFLRSKLQWSKFRRRGARVSPAAPR